MFLKLRRSVVLSSVIALGTILGSAGVYLLTHAHASALSDKEAGGLAEANDSSAMCVPSEKNDVFFVTCGGIY